MSTSFSANSKLFHLCTHTNIHIYRHTHIHIRTMLVPVEFVAYPQPWLSLLMGLSLLPPCSVPLSADSVSSPQALAWPLLGSW